LITITWCSSTKPNEEYENQLLTEISIQLIPFKEMRIFVLETLKKSGKIERNKGRKRILQNCKYKQRRANSIGLTLLLNELWVSDMGLRAVDPSVGPSADPSVDTSGDLSIDH